MVMANSAAFSSNLISNFFKHPPKRTPISPPVYQLPKHHQLFSLLSPKVAAKPNFYTTPAPPPPPPPAPINVEYLEREFGGHGAEFSEVGDRCVVSIELDDGSSANLVLPSGLITSYKPHMWHGGTQELLHTVVTEGVREREEVVISGGVSVVLEGKGGDGIPWRANSWVLHDVRGSPQDAIEVELKMYSRREDMAEVKYIVTLKNDALYSNITLSNFTSSPQMLTGSIMSHLTVSTPDATYAVGLQNSNYCTKPPLISDFSIIPPNNNSADKASELRETWSRMVRQGLPFNWGGRRENQEDGLEKDDVSEEDENEEDDNFKHLTDSMSKIYTYAPRSFTLIDRGRRNSVVVGRTGFDELYVYSPGSNHEWYGKYAYICTGPLAMLKPVVVAPGSVWKGSQFLHNPSS
ncbi:protein NDH-DEPENDENT CYCLIC ELECTRON FLOW 5 [Amborella trichopoda]|uniref:protein NDH-DEPENDENT CYCLIC ELECTRON FLOW 5 n=1 Tax=Amborella trichopoda TaxID=13333 RepID=UPI0005D3EC0D|nr:protein NDH-DEPENDENT CYCLIC ELECTRON FLOW 5 [Amborella trichopoda]|eukprot:XP_011622984.1 protein NDH-DEPENDENT CYCLIC ELECTRON FLOW 5 [Amborella trichopoda]